jgi:putative transposase
LGESYKARALGFCFTVGSWLPLLQIAKEATGKKPKTFITDGLATYHDAYKKEFWTLKGLRTEHVRHITIRGDHNNNKMERMNGEVRDREKVMRGLKNTDSAILSGYKLFHNYIRPHEGLNGMTPAQACGIEIEGNNKWLTLIQNSINSNRKASPDVQHEEPSP